MKTNIEPTKVKKVGKIIRKEALKKGGGNMPPLPQRPL